MLEERRVDNAVRYSQEVWRFWRCSCRRNDCGRWIWESVVKLIWAQKRKVRSGTEIVVVRRSGFGDYCSGQIVKSELNWW